MKVKKWSNNSFLTAYLVQFCQEPSSSLWEKLYMYSNSTYQFTVESVTLWAKSTQKKTIQIPDKYCKSVSTTKHRNIIHLYILWATNMALVVAKKNWQQKIHLKYCCLFKTKNGNIYKKWKEDLVTHVIQKLK